MKRILQWLAIAVVTFSLTSCGLPMSAVRSASSFADSVGGLLGPAATMAVL